MQDTLRHLDELMDVGSVHGVYFQCRIDQVFETLGICALGVLVLSVHDRHGYRTSLLRCLKALERRVEVSERK
jgi:hypothetical protein